MNLLQPNVGRTDRFIRLLLALVIGAAGLYGQSWLGLLAAVPLLTALTGVCPLYSLLGFSTCPMKPKTNPNQ